GSDEMVEAVKVLGARIDENIDVRLLTRLVARIGAEQVQRRHAVRSQLRLYGLEFGDDFVAVHAEFYRRGWRLGIPNAAFILQNQRLASGKRVKEGLRGRGTLQPQPVPPPRPFLYPIAVL